MLRSFGALGLVDSRQGIRKLENSARAHGYFLLWPGIRSGRVCRIGSHHGRSGLRACIHGARGPVGRGSFTHRRAAASGRGAISDVDVTAAKFARISGENEREYQETHGVDARRGGSSARGKIPLVVGGRRKL